MKSWIVRTFTAEERVTEKAVKENKRTLLREKVAY
jgi:hypothetical protein